MSSNAVKQVREQLDALMRVQADRAVAHKGSSSYRLRIQDDEGDCRIPRQVLCFLEKPDSTLGEDGSGPTLEGPAYGDAWCVPKSAKGALKSGRQAFSGPDDFKEHLATVLEQAAFLRLTSKLAARDRSGRELEELLVGEGYDRPLARNAVERARRCGLIDDGRFAQSFVCSKRRAGWGSRRIERDLLSRGVAERDVHEALATSDDDSTEFERALGAARKKRLPEKNQVEKLARFLAGRGFSGDVALRAAKQVVSESSEPVTVS